MRSATVAGCLVLLAALTAGCGASRTPEPVTPAAVDVGFCQDMAVHHAQALLMAQRALTRATDPAVHAIATDILLGQSQERGTLTGWLTLWRAPQLPAGPPMTWMSGAHTGHTMPGMATQAELDRLLAANGPDFDTLFLRLMIRHHSGGIAMANEAKDHATVPEVRAIAGGMVVAQSRENAVMAQLLTR